MSSIKRRIAAVLTTLVIATGAGAVQATPAHAAGEWECALGYVCVFEFQYGGGATYRWGPNYPAGCYSLGGFWNDRVQSASNRYTNGRYVTFYQHAQCQPSGLSSGGLAAGKKITFIPPYTQTFSSFQLWGGY